MKTFKEIADQCERIAKLYAKGFGSTRMLERVESIFFSQQSVGLCFQFPFSSFLNLDSADLKLYFAWMKIRAEF